jgi:hypothetical protein
MVRQHYQARQQVFKHLWMVQDQISSNANPRTGQDQTVRLMPVKIRDVPAAGAGSLQSWNENWMDGSTVKVNEASGNPTNSATMVYSNFILKRFSTVDDDTTKFVKGQTNGFNLAPPRLLKRIHTIEQQGISHRRTRIT